MRMNTINQYIDQYLREWIMVAVRVWFGCLWVVGAMWKVPPYFGLATHENLYYWMARAVDYPVFGPYTWIMSHIILPHFLLFAWPVYIIEITLGVVFVLGFQVRWFALLALFMTINIALTVLNTPGEWPWSYYLMMMVSLVLFAYPYKDSVLSIDRWIATLWSKFSKAPQQTS